MFESQCWTDVILKGHQTGKQSYVVPCQAIWGHCVNVRGLILSVIADASSADGSVFHFYQGNAIIKAAVFVT